MFLYYFKCPQFVRVCHSLNQITVLFFSNHKRGQADQITGTDARDVKIVQRNNNLCKGVWFSFFTLCQWYRQHLPL